ncbi:hypothetical protein JTI58_22305 [Lysinibacillus fusiformis]|uniref:hypothetical protein n=1 Tax=Lysinibacillus fusiformis TaxID=28031 RepID=UPI001967E6BA|nr:hypothetical protein [Lysinibacillus fusiformis]QSB09677.1 hypothetical protein JTI58_22305 [Lysinibacillus fusiformis]
MHKFFLYTTVLILNVFLVTSGYIVIEVAIKYFGFKLDWGFIGALIGGAISGGITLIGVKQTIQENKRTDNHKKHLIANYIFTELLSKINEVNSRIKSLPCDWDTNIDEIAQFSKELTETALVMKEEAVKIDILIYREVKSVEYNAENIYKTIIKALPGITDQQIMEELMRYRRQLSIADVNLEKIKNTIRHF